ncbi:conjugal transfer protein TraB [Ancylobacter amanitiformis]|uniref:CN hydrolase domain-containing protein n=1 Tax=Ancylobacter amanitiformis TaxID=217069 RepID=A0ABU0LXM7_9HYPH|nr:conjugal transfer protein TraB [Ancylobacter amanitiformis]MDQ0513438.1 hypothetical protein [Ancylobacter amanitiformis]
MLGPCSHSSPDRWRAICLTAAATVIGWIAWSGHVLALPLALLFPLLWACSPTRNAAVAVSMGYFLAASRGLPQGIATFFGASVWAGILLWLLASLSFVAVHAVFWTSRPGWRRALRYLFAAVLMAVPPFGIFGWAQPITAAGVLFPGWGWWGVLATTASLAVMTTRFRPAAVIALGGFWLWSVASWTSPTLPEGWTGVDTRLGAALGRDGALERHRQLLSLVSTRIGEGAKVVVLPESALGSLTPTVERFWLDALTNLDVIVIAGATVLDRDGYDNVMAETGPRGGGIRYRARMPVPISMWQPWRAWFSSSGGARATFFGEPVIEVAGRGVAPLICYEQLLVWPVLQSALHRPDVIVGIANAWWATQTSVPSIQIASLKAWSRLFGIPLVTAFNR